jgi:L-ascorbate metabolism protein UlaG (beta-lactamase superfamily)
MHAWVRMSFEDLLQKRLGPMRDLITWRTPRPRISYDPAHLWYRRALGVDLRFRPDTTWAEVEVAGAGGTWRGTPRADALMLAGLTTWTHASTLGLSPRALTQLLEQDCLYFSPTEPTGPSAVLSGTAGALRDPGAKLARRRGMAPVPALETPIEIKPFPFMPRGRELLGSGLVGFRWGSRERGHEVFAASITGTPRTGRVLRTLVAALDGTRTADELLELLPAADRTHAKKLLEVMDGLTALSTTPVRRWPAPADPRVTWLGHAAVLVETCGYRILVDPLFFADSDPVERFASGPRFDPRTLPPIDLVLITHGDNDHLNATSLALLPANTPIVIPKVRTTAEPWQVDVRGTLELLGFTHIHELDTWDTLALGPLTITACPFEGEDWELELPQATYLVESPEVSLYFSADAGPMPETYAALAARGRRVDLAVLGVSGCAEAMVAPRELGYGNFYEAWVPREQRNLWVQHTSGPRESAAAARALEPRYVFGYAAGGASFIQTAYSDVGDHAALAEALAGSAITPVALPLGEPWPVPQP